MQHSLFLFRYLLLQSLSYSVAGWSYDIELGIDGSGLGALQWHYIHTFIQQPMYVHDDTEASGFPQVRHSFGYRDIANSIHFQLSLSRDTRR